MRRRPDVVLVGGRSPLGRAIRSDLTERGVQAVSTSRSVPPLLDTGDAEQVDAMLLGMRPRAVVYLVNPAVTGLGRDVAEAFVHDLTRFARRAADTGVARMILTSSGAVYGTRRSGARTEADDPDPDGVYGRLKLASEEALSAVSASTGIDAVLLRIFNVMGPGFSGSLVNRLALSPDPPALWTSDAYVRDYVHATDVARAVTAALIGVDGAGAVNVGSGIPMSNARIASLVPGRYIDAGSDIPASSSVADISKAAERWGFAPRVTVEDALGDPAGLLSEPRPEPDDAHATVG